MSDDKDNLRNILLIPASKPATAMRGCPKCHAQDYAGRNIQGVITWTCLKCRNQWHGGLPQEPQDPTKPSAPISPTDQPAIQFVRGPHGEVVEQRRRMNPNPEFRKGLPIPEGEE